MTENNIKTKKILISSIPDYINAKAYQNSITKLMSSDDKKVTSLMIMKYLQLTSKEVNYMEKNLLERLKKQLVDKE